MSEITENLKDILSNALKGFNQRRECLKSKHLNPEQHQVGSTIVFKDVCVVLDNKEILNSISGMASQGQLLAIMGLSGAGKSTLLNTLAGRFPATSGSITLNGEPMSRRLRRKISYVLQQDCFYPNLTLRETLTFTTLLRLPDAMPHELKIRRMDEIIDVLELNKCLDTRIGSVFQTGLSGGEKKRASIACELLSNPKLLMLDEPTSGLDSTLAYSLMSILAKYSKQMNNTVLTTIHQPSQQLFDMFSHVLLITEGQMVFYGRASKLLDFFSSIGLHCDQLRNPADFVLEQMKSDPETIQRIVKRGLDLKKQDDWPDQLREDTNFVVAKYDEEIPTAASEKDAPSGNQASRKTTLKLEDNLELVKNKPGLDLESYSYRSDDVRMTVDIEAYKTKDDDYVKWQTGFLTQYVVLTRRAVKQSKGLILSPLNFSHVFMMFLMGMNWFQLPRNEQTANDRFGILYSLLVQQYFIHLSNTLTGIFDVDGVFYRERSAGIYRLSAYYLAIMTTRLLFPFLYVTFYAVIVYWMTNLMPAPQNFFAFWFVLTLSAFVSQSFGFFVGVLIKNIALSLPISQTLIMTFLLIGGFYNSHVVSWFSWARYLSCVTYSLSALGKIEYEYGAPFECNPPNVTQFPEYCTNGTTFPGVAFLNLKNLNYGPIYLDVFVLVGVIVTLRILTYLLLRFCRRP